MATSLNSLKRYVWLIDIIRRRGYITLADIKSEWKSSTLYKDIGEDLITRTFHNHKESISNLFNIRIECKRNVDNTYYIANPEIFDKESSNMWIYQSLSSQLIFEKYPQIGDKIIYEENAAKNDYLEIVAHALSKNQTLLIKYQGFLDKWNEKRLIEPYGLKQWKKHWYLLVKCCDNQKIYSLALDRIETIEQTYQSFIPDDSVNINTYYGSVIGINVDEDYDVEKIILRVYGRQRKYFESVPIHGTLRIFPHDKYSDYEFEARPEYELQHEILRHGEDIEVIKPEWLRKHIKSLALEIARNNSRKLS